MTARIVLLLVLLFGVVAFAAVNWGAIMTPMVLSLVVTTIEAPLGLIMLALLLVLTAIYVAYAFSLRMSVLVEGRRQSRELQAQRDLAEKAEASRLSELRHLLESRLQELEQRIDREEAGVLTRLDQLDRNVRMMVEQTGNSLAAYIGELEDRMEGEPGGKPERPS